MCGDEVSGQYKWTTPSGDRVVLSAADVEVYARVERVFTGARVIWWRKRSEWRRP